MTVPDVTKESVVAEGATVGRAPARGRIGNARTRTQDVPRAPEMSNRALADTPSVFLTAEERRFVHAAAARLMPKGERGPDVHLAGIATFIDRQLAGPFGYADTWCELGAWPEEIGRQDFRSKLHPAEIYRAAIKVIDAYSRRTYANKAFAEITDEQRDDVLSRLAKGEAALGGVHAKVFFDMFLQNTIEGHFSDPMSCGHADMNGGMLVGLTLALVLWSEY